MKALHLRIAALAVGTLALTAAAYQKEIFAYVGSQSADGRTLSGFVRLDAQSLRDTGQGGKPHTSGGGAFLQVPGVQGAATVNGKSGFIAVSSFSIGASSSKNSKPVLLALQITKPVDATSPLFSEHYFSGEIFRGTTTLEFVQSSAKAPLQEIQLSNVVVVSDAIEGSNDGANEAMTLAYSGIKFCTTASSETGSPTMTCAEDNFATPTPPPSTPTPSPPPPSPTPSPSAAPTTAPTPSPTSSPGGPTITEYSTGISSGAKPQLIRIVHGAMWFAENGTSSIATVSTAGVVHEYTTATGSSGPTEVVEAPNVLEGNTTYSAFTESAANQIGVMDSSGGHIFEYSIPTELSQPTGLTTDSSGANLWFTQNYTDEIGEIAKSTSGYVINEFTTQSSPQSIVENVADTNLYFTEPSGLIGVISNPATSPSIVEYSTGFAMGASPWGIALQGGTQTMWFTDQTLDAIGAFNTSSHLVTGEYSAGITTGDTYPRDIAEGPDGAMWFTEWGANKIGRIDPSTHTVTEYTVPTNSSKPYGIVKDPSGAAYMWFTECGTDKIGKIGPIPNSGEPELRHRKSIGAHARATASVHPKP